MKDGVQFDGLTDVYTNWHMANCAEKANKELGITRGEQDDYAARSYQRARYVSKVIRPILWWFVDMSR